MPPAVSTQKQMRKDSLRSPFEEAATLSLLLLLLLLMQGAEHGKQLDLVLRAVVA